MNLLESLPNSITVNNRALLLKTDFRVWLQFLQSLSKDITELELIRHLKAVFEQGVTIYPHEGTDVVRGVMAFVQGARGYQNDVPSPPSKDFTVPYDVVLDGNYIYAAFLEQYGIDLCDVEMHYYKYVALFESLREETTFKKIVGYRVTNTRKIKDKEQRAHAEKMRKLYEIVDAKALADFEAEKANILAEWS